MKQTKIAIIVSQFNSEVTDLMLENALGILKEYGAPDIFYVPGAVELPITAQTAGNTGKYNAIICFGCVILGETNHYDYVCSQVSFGCQKVALEQNLPVIFGVLTTKNKEQALKRADGTYRNKGRDAAEAALQMIKTLNQVKTTTAT